MGAKIIVLHPDKDDPPPKWRWEVVIKYVTQGEITYHEHQIEELEELAQIVEQGPDWNEIEGIGITYDCGS